MSRRKSRLNQWAEEASYNDNNNQQNRKQPAYNPYIAQEYEPQAPISGKRKVVSPQNRGRRVLSPARRKPPNRQADEWEVINARELSDYENDDDDEHLRDIYEDQPGASGFMMRVSNSLANLTDAFGYMLGTSDGIDGYEVEDNNNNNNNNNNDIVPYEKGSLMKRRQRNYRTPTQRIEAQLVRLNNKLNKYPLFEQLEQSTGIPRLYAALGIVILAIMVVIGGFGFKTLTALIGFTFPVYDSFKTIENPSPRLLQHWLMYWVVFSIYCSFESIMDHFLKFLPFFNLLKLVFLFWCFLPEYQGARIVYIKLLRPFLSKVATHIDEASVTVNKVVGFHAQRVAHRTKDLKKSLSKKLLND